MQIVNIKSFAKNRKEITKDVKIHRFIVREVLSLNKQMSTHFLLVRKLCERLRDLHFILFLFFIYFLFYFFRIL